MSEIWKGVVEVFDMQKALWQRNALDIESEGFVVAEGKEEELNSVEACTEQNRVVKNVYLSEKLWLTGAPWHSLKMWKVSISNTLYYTNFHKKLFPPFLFNCHF